LIPGTLDSFGLSDGQFVNRHVDAVMDAANTIKECTN
jgi:hypothetical protein